MVGRYTHAHQFKRARRELKFLRTRLGRIIRDVRRKIEGDAAGRMLWFAARSCLADSPSRAAPTRTKGVLVAAPEVECIGRGKARTPSSSAARWVATPATAPKADTCCMPRRCMAIRTTATRSVPSSLISKSSQVCSPPHPQRQGLSRPQLSRPVPGLDSRPGPPRHKSHSPRDATPSCRGARNRPSQGRPSDASQLSQGPRWRPH